MKIKILENVRFALGGIDVRDFKKGEKVDIADAHAYRMIELELAVDCAGKMARVVKEAEKTESDPVEESVEEKPVKKGKKKSK